MKDSNRQRHSGRGTRLVRGLLGLAFLAGAVMAFPAIRAGSQSTPSASERLEAEMGEMITSNPTTDPRRLALLQDRLDALERAENVNPPPEPPMSPPEGIDDANHWDEGVVECEPIPQGILNVDEIEGAVCLSVPLDDGTARYVAMLSSGDAHVVRFGSGSAPQRLADIDVPQEAVADPADTRYSTDPSGVVTVARDGIVVATFSVVEERSSLEATM